MSKKIMLSSIYNDEKIGKYVSKEMLLEIWNGYKKNPYHNFYHALELTMMLLDKNYHGYESQKLSIYQDLAAILAKLHHDEGHNGVSNSPHDEIFSANIAKNRMQKYGFPEEVIKKTQRLIMATIVSKRGEIQKLDEMEFVDLDISNLGREPEIFFESSFRILLEQHQKNDTINDKKIIEFFENLEGFFGYLTSITGDKNRIFLSDSAHNIFPYFANNRKKIQSILLNPKKTQYLIEDFRQIEKNEKIKKYRQKFKTN